MPPSFLGLGAIDYSYPDVMLAAGRKRDGSKPEPAWKFNNTTHYLTPSGSRMKRGSVNRMADDLAHANVGSASGCSCGEQFNYYAIA